MSPNATSNHPAEVTFPMSFVEAHSPLADCPSCSQFHDYVVFRPFSGAGYPPYKFWGQCPYTGEPILLRGVGDHGVRVEVEPPPEQPPTEEFGEPVAAFDESYREGLLEGSLPEPETESGGLTNDTTAVPGL